MIQELHWLYLFNLIVNSLPAFLTVCLLILSLNLIFRIKKPRIKAIMLGIPIVKLVVDPFLYDFHNWAFVHQMNPMEAETGSRMLSFMICLPQSLADLFPLTAGIGLSINNSHTFSPADIAALVCPPYVVKGTVLVMGTISLVLFGIHLIRLGKSMRFLSHLLQGAVPFNRILQNQSLIHQMKQTKTLLILSTAISIPCAFGIFRKRICLPLNLIEKLSQVELEAIIAHELNHLQWYDGLVRALCDSISALFWWIPTRWLLNRMEYAQEIACDASVKKLHIGELDLASAIVKTLKTNQEKPNPLLSTYFVQHSMLSKRLKPLLSQASVEMNQFTQGLQICFASFVAIAFFFGRFWIF